MKKRALLSVTDKSGLVPFAQQLADSGYELLSTGGTAKVLREAGLTVLDVAEVTGFPEMLDGRVKTLHPMVHGGLLGDRRLESHRAQMEEAGIEAIDLVVVNLYAFEQTIAAEHTLAEAIESIDIGGPTMIRSAAKNHANVTVVVDPGDYPKVAEAVAEGNLESHRLSLAAKAFRHTAYYDSVISRYLTDRAGETPYSETLTIGLRRDQSLRYGENPHQQAASYKDPLGLAGIGRSTQLWGKEISYNNLLDADAAWELVCDLPPVSCAIIKHGNPCGVANFSSFAESYREARASDPVSAFGGIAAFNGVVDEAAALAMTEQGNFLEVVIGTEFSPEAVQIFKDRRGWGQNVRLLTAPLSEPLASLTLRSIRGGYLVQDSDEEPQSEWKIPTQPKPSDDQLRALKLQWAVVKHVKSNAIVVGSAHRTFGVGAGQMNRVHSVELAIKQAGEFAKGSVLASDAFFPFPDSIERAAAAGIVAVIQPGGSKKDEEVISACDKHGISMILTNFRHFRH